MEASDGLPAGDQEDCSHQIQRKAPMPSKPDAVQALADAIRGGLPAQPKDGLRPLMEALFGERYYKNIFETGMLRDAYALAKDEDAASVPWSGLINQENPPSGPYGGTSLVWFPSLALPTTGQTV